MHVKDLANSLALVYNFYSLDYNSSELAEGYGWKDHSVLCFLFLFCVVLVFARGLAVAKCGGI